MTKAVSRSDTDLPLLVDLDGSLIRTDSLLEMVTLYIRSNPFRVFLILYWALQGKTHLKQEVAERTELDVSTLPFRDDVVEFLTQQCHNGRRLVLFTGAWESVAADIVNLHPMFESFFSSTDNLNLTGIAKRDKANALWGSGRYDYLGNELKDFPIWSECRRAIVVGSDGLTERVRKIADVEKQFADPGVNLAVLLKAIRVHQWAKNALIFVPLFTAQLFTNIGSIVDATIGFVVFCLISSATYLINDLFDLESDRKHASKRHRPLASGTLGIPTAAIIILFLGVFGIVASALLLPVYFLITLILYIVLTLLYSYKLKKLQTLDVISLASLFTLRVIAGAAAISVSVSFWLLSFSMFIFLSLALVKRVTELNMLVLRDGDNGKKIAGRGYYVTDIPILQNMGTTSGFLAVLVFAFYINSKEVTKFYDRPEILWLICPILGYWVMRIWMMTTRNEVEEDPIYFAITDRNSWLAVFTITIVMIAAYLY